MLAGKFFSQLLEDKDNKLIYLRKGNSELLVNNKNNIEKNPRIRV